MVVNVINLDKVMCAVAMEIMEDGHAPVGIFYNLFIISSNFNKYVVCSSEHVYTRE